MAEPIDRRAFLTAGALGLAGLPGTRGTVSSGPHVRRRLVSPVVISDTSGIRFKNGGAESAIERAFRLIVDGQDVLDAMVAGVNIVENDPTETGVGYGGLPNENGIVQLDASVMHGPRRRAGGVAALEGVRTPSLVAKAVMDHTDHHLLVGAGAQDFARNLGFRVEEDLNTDRSRQAWLEWKRRIDPSHYLDPRRRAIRNYELGLEMVREGIIEEHSFWGTVHCSGINPSGDICAVTTTSGLSFKIAGRTGDSPILGAGLYADNDVGAAGSTGRGEANLYNLTSYLVVENMRRGMHPKDAGLDGLRRIRDNTVEERLLNSRGLPAFNVRFFALNKNGEYAGVSMYAAGETTYGVCTEIGAEEMPLEPLLDGSPLD